MKTEITLDNAKGYKTEANLRAALKRTGLEDHPARRMICRKPDGTWTAVFLATEYLNREGGYAGFAAEKGFMSV